MNIYTVNFVICTICVNRLHVIIDEDAILFFFQFWNVIGAVGMFNYIVLVIVENIELNSV